MSRQRTCLKRGAVRFRANPLECRDLSLSQAMRGTIWWQAVGSGDCSRRSPRRCLADKSAQRKKRRQVAALQSAAGAFAGGFIQALRPTVVFHLENRNQRWMQMDPKLSGKRPSIAAPPAIQSQMPLMCVCLRPSVVLIILANPLVLQQAPSRRAGIPHSIHRGKGNGVGPRAG